MTTARLNPLLLVLAVHALPGLLSAQIVCSDGTTTYWQYDSVYRTSANNVHSEAHSYVTGDYYYMWQTDVSSKVYHYVGSNPVQYNSNYIAAGYGQTAIVWFNVAPSILGDGEYQLETTHGYYSVCNNSFANWGNQEVVNKPSITQSNAGEILPTTLWNLGPGTANAIPTSNGYTYRQSITLTANKNCIPNLDTCNDTPSWSINSPASTLTISPTSGSTTTLSKGSAMGNCQFDTTVSVSLGGFSSSSTTFVVNSPGHVVSRADLNLTEDLSPGYRSNISWQVTDVCAGGGDRLTTLPIYEAFQNWSFPGAISGWGADAAESASGFNYAPDPTVFRDYIYATDPTGTTFNPLPVWTSSGPPYTS